MAWIADGAHHIIRAGRTERWRIQFNFQNVGVQFISVHPKLPGRLAVTEISKEYLGWTWHPNGYTYQAYVYWVTFRNDSNRDMTFYFEGY